LKQMEVDGSFEKRRALIHHYEIEKRKEQANDTVLKNN